MSSLFIPHTLKAWTAFGSICVIVKCVCNCVIKWSATVLHISFLIFHIAFSFAGIIKATIFSTFILAFLHWLIANARFPADVPALSCSDSLAATVLTILALVTLTPFFPCWKQHKTIIMLGIKNKCKDKSGWILVNLWQVCACKNGPLFCLSMYLPRRVCRVGRDTQEDSHRKCHCRVGGLGDSFVVLNWLHRAVVLHIHSMYPLHLL